MHYITLSCSCHVLFSELFALTVLLNLYAKHDLVYHSSELLNQHSLREYRTNIPVTALLGKGWWLVLAQGEREVVAARAEEEGDGWRRERDRGESNCSILA